MRSVGYAVSILMALVAPAPASAQVINGESTYGDSDLHQPPEMTTPPPGSTSDRDERDPPREQPARR